MVVPVLWRTQKQRYSLQAEVCPHCTSAVFPPRSVCPYCRQAMVTSTSSTERVGISLAVQGREFVHTISSALTNSVPVAVAGDD